MELTELIEDYIKTEILSSVELDFLEGELWEILQHIEEINTLILAPKKICKKLKLNEKSSWPICCAAVLDFERPLGINANRVENLKKLIIDLKIDCK